MFNKWLTFIKEVNIITNDLRGTASFFIVTRMQGRSSCDHVKTRMAENF